MYSKQNSNELSGETTDRMEREIFNTNLGGKTMSNTCCYCRRPIVEKGSSFRARGDYTEWTHVARRGGYSDYCCRCQICGHVCLETELYQSIKCAVCPAPATMLSFFRATP